jgi:hypothetical protein
MAFSSAEDAIIAAFTAIDNATTSARPYVEIPKWGARVNKTDKLPAIEEMKNQTVLADGNGVVEVSVGGAVSSVLTESDALKVAKSIDKHNNGTNHLKIWSNKIWLSVYDYDNRQVSFIDKTGNSVTEPHPTIPCHNCGIVLPLNYVQIDHHMPQQGGQNYYTIKVLRALGLTLGNPNGKKGSAVLRGKFNANLVIHPQKNDPGNYDRYYLASDKNRWTTNNKGDSFLSVLAYANALNDVKGMCKNSSINLVPLCAVCNVKKSDFVRPIR